MTPVYRQERSKKDSGADIYLTWLGLQPLKVPCMLYILTAHREQLFRYSLMYFWVMDRLLDCQVSSYVPQQWRSLNFQYFLRAKSLSTETSLWYRQPPPVLGRPRSLARVVIIKRARSHGWLANKNNWATCTCLLSQWEAGIAYPPMGARQLGMRHLLGFVVWLKILRTNFENISPVDHSS